LPATTESMAQPHPRSPQQDLQTSKWLWLGFGTLTVVLVISVLVVFVYLRSLEAQLNEMATARSRSTAARETHINALDFVLGVHRYLETGDERFRRSAVDEADRTERAWADYERLAASERHRGLAARLSTIWVESKRLGEALMDGRDAQRPQQDLARFDDLSRQLEDLLDEEVQRDAEEEYRVQSETAFRNAGNAINLVLVLLVVGTGIAVVTSGTIGRGVLQAERARREQQELLRVTLASIGDAVITTDAAGHVDYLNGVAETLTGWKSEDAKGLALPRVFQIVDQQTRQSVENPALRALREGVIVGLANDSVLIAKDGSERPVDDSAAPIRDEDGNVLGSVLVFRDITPRTAAEKQLRESQARKTAIVESALDAVITIDAQGKIVEFNPAAVTMFGYTETEAVGQPMHELIIPVRLRRKHQEGFAHYLATGEGPIIGKRIEMPAVRSDGTEFNVELTVTRVALPGSPIFTGYIRDITALKEAQEEQHRLTTQLEAAVRAREDFLAVASHDLRNPVNAIQLQVTSVLRHCQREGVSLEKEWLCTRIGRASSQVSRLTRLLDNLMDVSRLTGGSLPLERENVDVSSVVHAIVDHLRDEIGQREVRLQVTPVRGEWDRVRLEQIVTNLVSNAIKYGAGKPIDISVDADTDTARLSVTDYGVGIDAKNQSRLFQRFERGVSGRQYGGFGLGLWITREIVEAMGGRISVESKVGKGSTFSVELPRVPPSAAGATAGTAEPSNNG
jgi:PAS domain S-box-containing protein